MARAPLAAALAAALAASAVATARAQNPTPAQNPPASAAQAMPPADSLEPLAVRPGDVVRIVVWGHPELSGEFPIDENYNLLFPLIGPISVRNLSVAQLRERLNTDLSQLFQRPFIAVTPLFRVAVLGEVLKPGLYSVDPTLTVFDVIALAGGPTRDANQNKLQLIRGGENIRLSLEPAAIARSTLRELGMRSGDQVAVPRAALTFQDWSLIVQIASLVLLVYTVFRK
ncbi:MAG: polysaccharide biosynthesis/export family protein [Gemmatimonadales bacterium]|jgi:polysaccharide export outer membrane protein